MVTPSLGLLWRYKKNLWSFSYFPTNLAEDKYFSIIHRTENHARSRQPGYSHHNSIMRYHIKYILLFVSDGCWHNFPLQKNYEKMCYFSSIFITSWKYDILMPLFPFETKYKCITWRFVHTRVQDGEKYFYDF